jgi:GrpB-like predicted nucleotidyltransferase (UPF0157 family)
VTLDERLAARLREAGVDPLRIGDPALAWRRLHEHEGTRATLLDRYALEGLARGIPVEALEAADRSRLAVEVLTARDPGFTIVPESGRRQRDLVDVVQYDPEWPLRFQAWQRRLAMALAAIEPRIEHIGSTAVPGLSAKPVIDVSIAVSNVEDEASYGPAIEGLGVDLRSRETGHRYFRPAGDRPREIQIHVCDRGSTFERAHLLFRDYLRQDQVVAGEYGRVKAEAAVRFRDDRIAYNEAKSGFILDTLAAAERWSRRVGWAP